MLLHFIENKYYKLWKLFEEIIQDPIYSELKFFINSKRIYILIYIG